MQTAHLYTDYTGTCAHTHEHTHMHTHTAHAHGPCQVTDNLRELLLCEGSDNAQLYSEEERSELLWRCFEHVCLGGPCCQHEVCALCVYVNARTQVCVCVCACVCCV